MLPTIFKAKEFQEIPNKEAKDFVMRLLTNKYQKEYDPEEEEAKTAKLRKQKAQSAKPKEAIPDPPQQREPTSM